MNKLVRFYNQNRHMVWIVILSIIAIISIIQVLDNLAYEKNNANKNINNYNNNSSINYSVITGQEVKTDISEVIDEFVKYCNNGQVEKAYEMLSDECKTILYPNLEDFTRKIL